MTGAKSTFNVDSTHIVPHGTLLEGVTYDGRTDTLYYIDIPAGTLFAIPNSSTLSNSDKPLEVPRSYAVDKSIGVIGLTTDPTKIICGVERAISLLDLQTGKIEQLAQYPNGNISASGAQYRSNDGSVGPDGTFWVGTMDTEEKENGGAMYVLKSKNGQLEELWKDCGCPNGINWDTKTGRMYWTDSVFGMVYKYDYNFDTNEVDMKSKVPFFTNHGTPDGSCLDADGNLYVALWGSNRIVRMTPDQKIDMEWVFPSRNITCCTFGDKDLTTLYVTSANLNAEDQPDANDRGAALYRIDLSELGIKGLAKYQFVL